MPEDDFIILNAFTMAAASHLNYGFWRHPSDHTHRYTQLDYWTNLARLLDEAGFDCLFIADALGPIDVYGQSADASLRHGIQSPLIDPMLPISAMAAVTRSLGFGVTLSTTYEHPYLAARKFTTLDHLTAGRIGWNVVTSQQESAARNLGLDRQILHDARYDRADEFMDVVYKLWQGSWQDDAVVRDPQRGIYTDPDKVHPIGHEGGHFRVPDMHVAEPSPQRVPVLFQAGASGRGMEFAARHAEVVFIVGVDAEATRANADRVRDLAARLGRDPARIKFITSAAVVTGANDREAWDKFEDYKRYYDPIGSIIHYSSMTGIDFSTAQPDQVLRYQNTEASQSSLSQFDNANSGRKWTLDEAVNPKDGFGRARTFIGGPERVADSIEAWLHASGTDGINLIQLINPASYTDFATFIVPELRRRGRLRPPAYATLRETLFPHSRSARPDPTHPSARYAV
ncbi:MAG: NtaA/DmoA family FMN-dependent monooxygenase [Janthinobacterium lividum]